MAPPKGGFAPNLEKFLRSLKSRPVEALIEDLIALLKRRQIKGSEDCAIATAYLLIQIVNNYSDKWIDVDQLIERIQSVGRRLAFARPAELAIVNVVRRVLCVVREETNRDSKGSQGDSGSDQLDAQSSSARDSPAKASSPPAPLSSLGSFVRTQSAVFKLLADPSVPPLVQGTETPVSGVSTPLVQEQSINNEAFRTEVSAAIKEIIDEMKQVDDEIQTHSDANIHPGDYILVYQPSRTVQKFLMRSKRKFTVFLTEDPSDKAVDSDPYASFRKSLAANGSTVINVMNTGLMAYLPRVNKVVLGARAITATGNVIMDAGAAAIARAARQRDRTVILLGGVFKISPDSRGHQDLATDWAGPSKYVNFSEGRLVRPGVTIKVAESEMVPSEHVDIYITNVGLHTRGQLEAVIVDSYKEEASSTFDYYSTVRR